MKLHSWIHRGLLGTTLLSFSAIACSGSNDDGNESPLIVDPEAGGGSTTGGNGSTGGTTGGKPGEATAGRPGTGPGGTTPTPGEEHTDPDEGIDFGDVSIKVGEVTSSTAQLSWDAIPGATSIRVLIGPEPKGEADAMALEVEEATLGGSATTYKLEKLAASTDVFVQLVADTPDGEKWGIAHARTVGGPRKQLDTPLRSVHAMGASTLMLVLETKNTKFSGGGLAGARGAAWQSGQWTITRSDGTPIAVKAVHRRSIPVGQPNYPVGFNKWGDNNVVDVDDHIFIELGEEIGESELLHVTHSGGGDTALDVRVPFSDKFLETPLLKVNQVGYNPRAKKRYAYVQAYLGDGGQAPLGSIESAEVLAEPRNPLRPARVVAAELPVTERSANDSEAGGAVDEIDLSSVPAAEGVRYRVRIPGVGVSFPTAVSEKAALKAFYVVARGMFHNRWCGDLDPKYTEWSRPEDHCKAYLNSGRSYREEFFPQSTPKGTEIPVRGGHHDAGDFDLRPFHVVVGEYLMRAYEANAESLGDGQLDIPESGNGIPDLLDEALWSLKSWQDLQMSDGSIHAGVESWAHPKGYYYANDDQLTYWTFDAEAWHTAYVSALFAQASHLVKPFDADRAEELLADAKKAYAWGQGHGAPAPFLLYAASELSRASGERGYLDDFEDLWAQLGGGNIYDRLNGWAQIYPGAFGANAPILADYTVGYTEADGANATIVGQIQGGLGKRAVGTAGRFLESGHAMRNARPESMPPDWGALTVPSRHADPIFAALSSTSPDAATNQKYIDALSLAADYALGANPMGMVVVTGLGSVSPQEPLHGDSLAFIKDKGMPPMPGIPVYGPVRSFPAPAWYDMLEAGFYPSYGQQPMGMHHVDSRTAVNMSEFTIWENQAPLTALFATLAPKLDTPEAWAAGGEEHRSTLPSHTAD
jgi:endoglucanase